LAEPEDGVMTEVPNAYSVGRTRWVIRRRYGKSGETPAGGRPGGPGL